MKIYDTTLQEVFKKLPPLYKALVVIGGLFIVISFSSIFWRLIDIKISITRFSFLQIIEAPNEIKSFMQPSMTSNPTQTIIAFSEQAENIRNIRLLRTINSRTCHKWTYIPNQGIEGKIDNLLLPDGSKIIKSGIWSAETPTIIYTPEDKGKEWKLFAYKYFWSFEDDINSAIDTAKKYSMITYKYSSNPTAEWSNEQWLFSPNNSTPPNPYNNLVKIHLNKLSPELDNITSYARPSVIYQDGILFMSLSAFTDKITPDRTIIIASTDLGENWIYVGTPIKQEDSIYFNNELYKGATLIQHHKNIYLAATFGTISADLNTYMIRFKDPGSALLDRNKNNAPIRTSRFGLFRKDKSTSGGFPAYNDTCKSIGMIVSERDSESGNFILLSTKRSPVR